MDGLMIDSERVTYEEYDRKLAELGYDFNKETYMKYLGRTKESICQDFYEQYGAGFAMEEVWEDVHVRVDHRLEENVPIKKGLLPLLDYLKEHDVKLAVASSSKRARVVKILENAKIMHYFERIVCGDEVSHSKPDPEIFLTAAKNLGIMPEDCLVLEDSEAGILGAYRGGFDVICVPDMKYPEETYATKTKLIADSLLDVIDYLNDI